MEKVDTTSAKKSSNSTKKSNTTQKNQKNESKDGINNLIQTIISGMGDPNSQGNAGTLYNIIKTLI